MYKHIYTLHHLLSVVIMLGIKTHKKSLPGGESCGGWTLKIAGEGKISWGGEK